MIPRIGLYALAAMLLAAHFLRAGDMLMVAVCACSPVLFLWRKRWILVGLQILAYCGAGIWIATALHLVQARQLAGRSPVLGAGILGVVALVTLAAGLLLNSRSMKERYPGRPGQSGPTRDER